MENQTKTSYSETTSGQNLSYWIDSVDRPDFEKLNNDIETDVVIIGAGISGLSVAYNLVKSGRQVIVIDDGFIGSGETGRTTAHVANALDDRYAEIETYHGEEGAKIAAESHTAAIKFIETTAKKEGIDCDFIRLDGYLFLHPTDEEKTLTEELKASHRAGINTQLITGVPGIPAEAGICLKFPQQAQFHPLKYIKGLAQAITGMGSKIYTQTRAEEIGKDSVKANGYTIKAHYIVVATNTPVNDWITMHTKQFPYRTYVIGAKVAKGKLQPALWWDTGDQESKWLTMPYHYARTQTLDDQYDLLICGGEDHKTGQADEEGISEGERYERLENWLRERFPDAEEIVYRWSGQVMESLDTLGFIGRNPGDDNTFIVTGDSGNGMTNGTIAGILIADMINGIPNAWEKTYSPARIKLSAAKDFVLEMGNTLKQYTDLVTQNDVGSVKDIKPGEGAIVSSGLNKVAVYRDTSGKVNTYSAICPHMQCVVQWNNDEKSFDCPCHGSRFSCDGTVINGPAITDLQPVDFKE